MNKKILLISIIFCLLTMFSGCGGNMKNSIGVNGSTAKMTFTDTGLDVKNHQGRVYHVIEDLNGFLYYCTDIEGNLTLVLDENGFPSKDISVLQ